MREVRKEAKVVRSRYNDQQSPSLAIPVVRPEAVLQGEREISLKDKSNDRPEVAPEVAPKADHFKKPRPEVVTEVAPETAPKKPRPEVVTEVAPETRPKK